MNEMTYRQLGDSGLRVSAVGIGTNAFSRRVDQDGVNEIMAAARDVGVTLLDTADVYGATHGASEELLGLALEGQRDEFVVATKFGGGRVDPASGGRGSRRHRRGGRGQSAAAAHRPHRPLPAPRARRGHAGRGDPVGADRPGAVREGALPRQLELRRVAGRRRGLDGADGGFERFVSAQNGYSLLDRSVEEEVVPACEAFGLGMLPYFPLEYGLLTGKYRRGEAAPDGSRAALDPDRAQWLPRPTGTGSRP